MNRAAAKRTRAILHLADGDHIVSAWPERCAGPGWSNRPVWVIVQAGNGPYRMECLQPSEQTREILALFDVAEAAHRSFVGAVVGATQAGDGHG